MLKKLLQLLFIINISNSLAISVTNYSDEKPKSANYYTTSHSAPQKLKPGSACWSRAESRYGVPASLLVAIAKVESRFNPRALGKNDNGSYDIGLMQINSGWLKKLQQYNISENDLYDPCTNIMVGAWILSDNINRLGYNWNAVGAYNAKTISKREKYAKKVHKAIIELGYNN
ncbi:lytic transglycosylase domain-containing protein [Aquella oligotrophica]|uniref:Transglycosylase SLT domain-containing protein n=1 Tax=Aquella oligotrophica TaxID=2067065 RepID=A0A2I7N6M7_9NEIS|nr:lytic transglycosylase domain-containing protein [Aquella oligotrophica]AUR52108.1 hypothetical protein CUN60_07265 [Aquella oligotrophica]